MIGLLLSWSTIAKEVRKPTAQSFDLSQFQDLVSGRLKGQWIEISNMTDLSSTTVKYILDGSEFLTTGTVRSHYLKVISVCGEMFRTTEITLICKVK